MIDAGQIDLLLRTHQSLNAVFRLHLGHRTEYDKTIVFSDHSTLFDLIIQCVEAIWIHPS
jgi:hypothetical protein